MSLVSLSVSMSMGIGKNSLGSLDIGGGREAGKIELDVKETLRRPVVPATSMEICREIVARPLCA
jgi:hypothetical protein